MGSLQRRSDRYFRRRNCARMGVRKRSSTSLFSKLSK